MNPLTTRIAPSPTGPTHLGTIRTAYFNWLAARSTGGRFIVRIDDTDKARSEDKYADQFLQALEWLGLDYDVLCRQSGRLRVYHEYRLKLVRAGLAREDEGCWRLCLGELPTITHWHDQIAGDVPIHPDNLKGFDQQVIFKADGTPTYHFASVVDDIVMNINYIIRGVDHTTNTARQVMLFALLGAEPPTFAHIGLLHFNGKKMSKRDKSSTIGDYVDSGIHPEALLNFLARLGWGPSKDDKSTAILDRKAMLDMFLSGGRMKNNQANVDMTKLESFDRKYKARDRQRKEGTL